MSFLTNCEKTNTEDREKEKTEAVSRTEAYESDGKGVEDPFVHEFVEKYPGMEFAYVPTRDGEIRTVQGNFQVEIDGIEGPDELDKLEKFLGENYSRRDSLRAEFNKGIDSVAEPEGGYEAYFEALEANLSAPEDVGGETVFIELTIDEKGNITDVSASEYMYYIGNEESMKAIHQAAISAVKETDMKWKPATKNGQPAKMKIELPITFPTEDS
ncbi:hypothetical protein C900_05511 [Fulvivirga imtechensis AK7]|uniref:TonB C-terminal domain-containing protein n=2 Tax=Fulvivirga TaxID=396811 RepID=L8JJE6_9BACT|nr:hypothetical protein C900_05511 [Fulvivirga imtechensis AK7]